MPPKTATPGPAPKGYNDTILTEAKHLKNLGDVATEDEFHGLYNAILAHWFPTSKGYIIEHQVLKESRKPEYIVVRHAAGKRNPILITELKRPKAGDAGMKAAEADLVTAIEGRFSFTVFDIISGLGGVGLRWGTYKMVKSGEHKLLPITTPWLADISSNTSFNKFEETANLIYDMKVETGKPPTEGTRKGTRQGTAEERKKALDAQRAKEAAEADQEKKAEEAEKKKKAEEVQQKKEAAEAQQKKEAEEAAKKKEAEEAAKKKAAEEEDAKKKAEEEEAKKKAEEEEAKKSRSSLSLRPRK